MDLMAIRTTEDFLKENDTHSAVISLTNGKTYETKFIYKIVQPSVAQFEPFLIVDVALEGDDLAIIPVSNIHHIVITGPGKEKKVGFFIEKTQ
ncbi:MAG: hypothetical protein GF333_08145 [Candidatus Omnitrophica bacterium]|nr:hypothetical protein [Candidatus Omnitrophota bacterium]